MDEPRDEQFEEESGNDSDAPEADEEQTEEDMPSEEETGEDFELKAEEQSEPEKGEPVEEPEPPAEEGASEQETKTAQPASGFTPPDEGDLPDIPSDKDEQTMGMLAHLLGIISGFLGPLIIWLVKKDESEFVDDQGKEALNFQVTLLIGYLICFGPLNLIFCIGSFLGMALWVVAVVFCIMGATSANKGEVYRYPFNIRMIK